MSEQLSEQLKPCPFCGSDGTLENTERDYASYVFVECSKCHTRGNKISFHTYYNCEGSSELARHEREAVAAWNTRKPDAALVAALKAVLADHDERRQTYPGTETQPNRVKVMEQARTALRDAGEPL